MLGKLLQAYRKGRGKTYTLDYIARKSGVSKNQLTKIENEEVSLPTNEMLLKIMVNGLDTDLREAEEMILEWKIEEGVLKAAKSQKIINIIASNSVIIGNNNMGNIHIKRQN